MKNLKPIDGYSDQYFAHPDGYIYSRERVLPDGRRIRGRVLKPSTRPDGYSVVTLYKEGEKKQWLLHRLIASCFLAGYSDDLTVNHKNLVKGDNRASNLEMMTTQENTRHARDNGHFSRANVRSKKTVDEIKQRLKSGEAQKDIAESLGVSAACVCRINKGKSYDFY